MKVLQTTLLAVSLALCNSALAQTTLTLTGAAADTGISASSPDANNGAGTTLIIGDDTPAAALVRFAIFQREGGPVPNNAIIISATLSLYKFSGPDGLFEVERLDRNWLEGEATWNVASAGEPWEMAGALHELSAGGWVGHGWVGDAGIDACTAAPFPDSCWLSIDVTSDVKAIGQWNFSNPGWRVGQARTTGNTQTKEFYSKDNATFPNLRPKLTVTYSMPVTVTLIRSASYTGTTDTWIDAANPDINRGSTQSLRIRGTSNAALIRFAIFQTEGGPVPDGAEILSATLSLYKYAGPATGVFAEPLTRPWNELQATWNVSATNTPWTAPGAGTNVISPGEGGFVGDATANNCTTAPFPDACWVHIDVSTHVWWFVEEPGTNFGWRLSQSGNSTDTTSKDFNSAQNSGFPTLRPKLTVTYAPKEFPSLKTPVAAADGETRPTFHSMSLYWNPPGFSDASPPPGNRIFVRYRKAVENPEAPDFAWKQAWPMWYDVRNATAGWGTLPHTFRGRGSVVYLTPGTKYVFELGMGADYAGADFTHHLVGMTWSEIFNEGPVRDLDDPPEPPRPIASRAPADGPLIITEGGDSTGYVVYDGWNATSGTKNVIDRGGANADNPNGDLRTDRSLTPDASSGIVVKASFVIIRRVVVKGAALSNIYIHPNVTDVIIEDCELSDWAWRPNGSQPAPTEWGTVGRGGTGGVHLSGNNSRIVIQRNRIFDPHLGTSPWDFGHSAGPNGITIESAGQQNVVRYNEIYSTNPAGEEKKHWYNDGIGGSANFSDKGSPGSDSDIYHNNIRNVMDDGIEAEGGGLNVRVWGNYVDHSMVGIATTTVHFGPTYLFRNVLNRMRTLHTHRWGDNPRIPPNGISDPDDDFTAPLNQGATAPAGRGAAFKSYGSVPTSAGIRWGGGRRYVFHNTVLQQPRNTYDPVQQWGDLGAAGGIGATSDQGMRETMSRNNILDTYRPGPETAPGGLGGAISIGTNGTATNDFDFDLWSGAISSNTPPFEANGVKARPTFRSGHGWMAFPRFTSAPNQQPDLIFGTGLGVAVGSFQLLNATGSPGLNAGQPLPNFSFDVDNLTFARKSGVELSANNPDMGAHDGALQETMKFGIPAGP